MIKSMTGYGKAEAALSKGKLTIEIRSLNSKNADISIKSYLIPKDKELYVRQKIASRLQRGTIDVYLTWEAAENAKTASINKNAALAYFKQVSQICSEAGCADILTNEAAASTLLSSILRMPEVMENSKQEILSEEEWPIFDNALDSCLEAVNKYREDEGAILYKDVATRVSNIMGLSAEIEGYEQERICAVREKLVKALEDLGQKPDKDRFEQELVFYLEKLDINEERVRLRQHCDYFMNTIDSEEYPGKKLGFIIQEIGREINTTGSKANHASIQKCVVRMKDELEKIREQTMNIL